jgi:superfamily II DNA/RNA helicase
MFSHVSSLLSYPLQATSIKDAMDGKDIVARARTGSGKTGAYALPALHNILQEKKVFIFSFFFPPRGLLFTYAEQLAARDQEAYVRLLVLVPTKELSQQTAKCIKVLSTCLPKLCRHPHS